MALAVSNYLADAWLNQTFRNVAWTRPSTVYIALYTSNPTAADTGTEVTGGAYVRRAITFGAPAVENVQIYHPVTGVQVTVPKRTIRSNAEVAFPTATADWGTITHVGIRDAATGGNLLFYGAVDNPRTLQVNDLLKFPAAAVALSLN
jgi:DMSO/TMAO reductase YedYZ molybdopterin-dependent catalytic subunit